MTTPPPPPRREPEAAQAPGEPRPPDELWGTFINHGWHPIRSRVGVDALMCFAEREDAERYSEAVNRGTGVPIARPALIGVSPAVHEQRDRLRRILERLTRVAKQVERFLIESRNPNALDIFQALNLETTVARAILSEIEGGGRAGTDEGEQT